MDGSLNGLSSGGVVGRNVAEKRESRDRGNSARLNTGGQRVDTEASLTVVGQVAKQGVEQLCQTIHSVIAEAAPKAYVTYSSSAELAAHNAKKRELSFSPDLGTMPTPEYRRYGNDLLIKAERKLTQTLNVGTAALYPSRFSALINTIYSYVDTRDTHSGAARKVLVDKALLQDARVGDFFAQQLPRCGVTVESCAADELATRVDGHFLVIMKGQKESASTVQRVSAALQSDRRALVEKRRDAGLVVTTSGDLTTISHLAHQGATVVVGNVDSVESCDGTQLGMGVIAGGVSPSHADPTIWEIRERRGLYGHAPDLLNESAVWLALGDTTDSVAQSRSRILHETAPRLAEMVSKAEAMLAQLEGYPASLIFNSGMQAVTTALTASLQPGDFLIVPANLYRNTLRFTNQSLRARGIEVRVIDYSQPREILRAIKTMRQPDADRKGVLYFESPTIPYLRVTDPELMGKIGRKYGLRVIVDSTVASPVNQQPVKFLDPANSIVLHSLTKLGQLNLGLGGGMSASREIVAEAHRYRPNLPGLFETAALVVNLPTITERVEKQNRTGLAISAFLREDRDARRWVRQLWYPADPSHPDYAVAQKVHPGKGGLMMYLQLDLRGIPDQGEFGYLEASRAFVDATSLPNAASFGGPETLIQVPVEISYSNRDREGRIAEFGVDDDIIRLSFGLEESEWIIQRLKKGFLELGRLYG
jgi:cystathionine gamma-synthase